MKNIKLHPFAAFVLIGAALFLADGFYQKAISNADYRIELSQSEIERLASLYARQQKKPVNETDLKQLIRIHVEEFALAREAERLDLGANDTIIRRRLVQKMKFILEDKHSDQDITEEELRGFFEGNKSIFSEPARVSFDHVFISPKDDSKVFERALKVKYQLDQGMDWKTAGDPFMLNKSYADLTFPEIARLFGSDFATRLSSYEMTGESFGPPIGSAYGVHLVRLSNRSEMQERAFEEVKDEVLKTYLSRLRAQANQQAIENIISKYDIVFIDDVGDDE